MRWTAADDYTIKFLAEMCLLMKIEEVHEWTVQIALLINQKYFFYDRRQNVAWLPLSLRLKICLPG